MRNKSLSKESVLNTAELIIIKKGLDQCTIRTLAKELNVAVGTLYNYYSSRDQLLHDLFKMSWNKTISRLRLLSENDELSIRTAMKAGLKIIQEDVSNRGGLGREMSGNSSRSFFSDIRSEIIESFTSIQMKFGLTRSKDLCNRATWIYAIVTDEFIFDKQIDDDTIDSIVDFFMPLSEDHN